MIYILIGIIKKGQKLIVIYRYVVEKKVDKCNLEINWQVNGELWLHVIFLSVLWISYSNFLRLIFITRRIDFCYYGQETM